MSGLLVSAYDVLTPQWFFSVYCPRLPPDCWDYRIWAGRKWTEKTEEIHDAIATASGLLARTVRYRGEYKRLDVTYWNLGEMVLALEHENASTTAANRQDFLKVAREAAKLKIFIGYASGKRSKRAEAQLEVERLIAAYGESYISQGLDHETVLSIAWQTSGQWDAEVRVLRGPLGPKTKWEPLNLYDLRTKSGR